MAKPAAPRKAETIDRFDRYPEAETSGLPNRGSKTETAPAGKGDGLVKGPCCCSITIYGRIRVKTLTDAGGVPLISTVIGALSADHVFIRVEHCNGEQIKYPRDNRGIEVNEGGTTGLFKFAEIAPGGTDCRLKCEVQILVHKDSRFNRVLDRLRKLEIELAQAYAEYQSSLGLVNSASPLTVAGLNIAGLMGKITASKQRIELLTTEIDGLIKELLGTGDTLMLDERIDVSGAARCTDQEWISALRPYRWTADSADPNRATVTISSGERLGGEWELELVALRDCPH